MSNDLDLSFGLAFADLYRREGLVRLDAVFLDHLDSVDAALHARLLEARRNPETLAAKPRSELIVELAPHVEDFIGELFGIPAEFQALQARHNHLAPFLTFKRKFIQKRAISGVTKEQASAIDGPALAADLETVFNEPLTEKSFFEHVSRWLENEPEHAAHIQIAAR